MLSSYLVRLCKQSSGSIRTISPDGVVSPTLSLAARVSCQSKLFPTTEMGKRNWEEKLGRERLILYHICPELSAFYIGVGGLGFILQEFGSWFYRRTFLLVREQCGEVAIPVLGIVFGCMVLDRAVVELCSRG